MKQDQAIESIPQIPDAQIAIVQSKWYREYTDSMVGKCVETLQTTGCQDPEIHVLPGSLELPLAAQYLIQRRTELEAIIAFGVIVKGETFHFEMISNECMRGFGQVMLDYDIPILVEVIPVTDIELIKARSGDSPHNKGIEAAIAAAEIIAWRRSLAVDGLAF
ncbi:MAG: 6,7-dimethyl-8-ribityllumazine synthase [Bdellovibrionales bacterium]|nr:6,7-dimethyl-8-ribityllumazine synthase [Bdellovibrionales bacterium]